MHVSIEEWVPDKFTAHNFTANSGQDIWQYHNSLLASFAHRKLRQYHKITHEILQDAMYCANDTICGSYLTFVNTRDFKRLSNDGEDAEINFDAMSDNGDDA